MSEWILPFPLLKQVRAAMADEDASEEQIEAALLAFQEVTGMNVLDAEPVPKPEGVENE